jgi:hypothetical protein
MSSGALGRTVQRATGRGGGNDLVDRMARIGVVARGIVFLVLAVLVARIASGALGGDSTGKAASGPGVARTVAAQTGGRVMLFALAVGALCYALFGLFDAALRHHESSDAKKWAERGVSLWAFFTYGAFSGYSFYTAFSGNNESGSSRQEGAEQSQWSARVLRWPGGQLLLLAIGIALFVAAAALAVRAVRGTFRKRLDEHRMSRPVRRTTVTLGTLGLLGRASLFAIVGWFVTDAAIENNPSNGKGVDGSIRSLANDNGGAALLWVVAIALIAFGLYLFLEARYRRV